MNRYYDKQNNRLVYVGNKSNSEYWDMHWDKYTINKMYPAFVSPFDYVINTTKKYLPLNSKILEGGCGVDYAKKTVDLVNKIKPELNIKFGDVQNLEFDDHTFDGYWSFGVIEHFYHGYERILLEMKRVIKPNGYLFVTFPHMCKLRKIKAHRNKYEEWSETEDNISNFYQFALDESKLIEQFEKEGFAFIGKQHLSGIKGIKDEIRFLNKPLQRIYSSKIFLALVVSKIISTVFNRFSSHSILVIFKLKTL